MLGYVKAKQALVQSRNSYFLSKWIFFNNNYPHKNRAFLVSLTLVWWHTNVCDAGTTLDQSLYVIQLHGAIDQPCPLRRAKPKRQYLLTLQVSRYCLLALQSIADL